MTRSSKLRPTPSLSHANVSRPARPLSAATAKGQHSLAKPLPGLVMVLAYTMLIVYPFHMTVSSVVLINASFADPILVVLAFVLIISGPSSPGERVSILPFIILAMPILISLVPCVLAAPRYFSAEHALAELARLFVAFTWCITFSMLIRRMSLRRLHTYMWVGAIFAAGQAAWTLLGAAGGQLRPTGSFQNPNIYANYLSFGVAMALAAAVLRQQENLATRLPSPVLLVPFLVVAVISTGSRGGFLGLLCGAVLFGLVLHPKSPRLTHIAQGGLVLAGVLGIAVWFLRENAFVTSRLESIISGEGPNVQSRLQLWSVAARAYFEHPFFGIGYGQFPLYAQRAISSSTVSHNTYLSWAAELGSFGLVAWAGFLIRVTSGGLRSRVQQQWLMPFLCFLSATLVQGLFANVDGFRSLWMTIGFLSAFDVGRNTAPYRASVRRLYRWP